MNLLFSNIRPAISMTALMTLIVGLAYPLSMTGLAQMVFPDQANGSLIKKGGTVIGSARIGQSFNDPRYLIGRPSAVDYDAANSGGSNLGPSSRRLIESVREHVAFARELDGVTPSVDRVTASGSGLDPHLSFAGAFQQVYRIARLRGTEPAKVRAILKRHIEGAYLGFIGKPVVNVLLTNLALDQAFPLNVKKAAQTGGAPTGGVKRK